MHAKKSKKFRLKMALEGEDRAGWGGAEGARDVVGPDRVGRSLALATSGRGRECRCSWMAMNIQRTGERRERCRPGARRRG